jgi:hypothetical protein
MKFFFVLFWDVIENLPIALGFLTAVRLRRKQVLLALTSLMLGAVGTSLLIHLIQGYRLSGVPELDHPPTLVGMFVNMVFIMGMSIPLVFYCSTEVWWSNWKTDVVLGLLAGMGLALAQAAFGWSVDVFHIPLHVIALALSSPVFLLGVRYLRDARSWPLALMGMTVCTVVFSTVIIAVDYRSF